MTGDERRSPPQAAPLGVHPLTEDDEVNGIDAAPAAEADAVDLRALNKFLDVVYAAENTGYAFLAVGKGLHLTEAGKNRHTTWREESYAWPEQRTELVQKILDQVAADADVYACPYLMRGRERKKGQAVERRLVHADIDVPLPVEKVEAVGGFAVSSGSEGHGHAYIALSAPVSTDQHEVLCRAWGRHLVGKADAKISDNDFLRLPGTYNRKPTVRGGEPVQVRWLVEPVNRWDPAELAAHLRARTPTASTTTTIDPAEDGQLVALDAGVREALEHVTGDRSNDTMRVVRACADAGLTVAQMYKVVRSRDDLRERLDERTDDDVRTCWDKIMDARQQRMREGKREQRESLELAGIDPTVADAPVSNVEPRTQSLATTVAAGRPRLILADRVLTRSQLADLPSPEPLIEDTLDRRTVALLAGGWGTGKTFLALDWAACTGTGRIWQRRKITQTGRVLYIASEGAFGFGSRVDAWEYGFRKRIADEALTVLPVPVNLRDAGQVAELCAIAEGCALVVVDTLARCLVGADENSAKDMGEAVDALYRLRDVTGDGTVLAVHHTGKDGETTRGSSALEAGVDTVYKTKGDARLIELSRTKRKDGPTEDRLQLTLNPVAESCVVVSTRGLDTTPSADALLSTFRATFADTGATKGDLRAVAGTPSATFHRAVNELVRVGALVNTATGPRPFYELSQDS